MIGDVPALYDHAFANSMYYKLYPTILEPIQSGV